jgi:acetyl-CoA carboxylase carboxyltransferase component
VHGPELEKLKASGKEVPAELQERIAKTRADYERWLDAHHAAARGHCDAILDPLETRRVLAFVLEFHSYSGHREHLVLETLT